VNVQYCGTKNLNLRYSFMIIFLNSFNAGIVFAQVWFFNGFLLFVNDFAIS